MLLPLRFEPYEGMRDYPDLGDLSGRLFLEDSFDPVTRIRRGRVYSGGHLVIQYFAPPNSISNADGFQCHFAG